MTPAARVFSRSSRTRRSAATALAVCGLMLLGAAPGWAKGRIAWHGCGPEQPASLQCGELSVPLDYQRPYGAKITLGLNRLRAADRAHRVGSLIVNPGRALPPGTELQPARRGGRGCLGLARARVLPRRRLRRDAVRR